MPDKKDSSLLFRFLTVLEILSSTVLAVCSIAIGIVWLHAPLFKKFIYLSLSAGLSILSFSILLNAWKELRGKETSSEEVTDEKERKTTTL